MKQFKKDLEHLINLHSIENECDMPDFLLAELVVNFIKTVGISIKKNLDWHDCTSVCHPAKQYAEQTLAADPNDAGEN